MFKNLAIALVISIIMVGCNRVNVIRSNSIDGSSIIMESEIEALVKNKNPNRYGSISTAILSANIQGDIIEIEVIDLTEDISIFLTKKNINVDFSASIEPGNYIINLSNNTKYKFDLLIFEINNELMGIILNEPHKVIK